MLSTALMHWCCVICFIYIYTHIYQISFHLRECSPIRCKGYKIQGGCSEILSLDLPYTSLVHTPLLVNFDNVYLEQTARYIWHMITFSSMNLLQPTINMHAVLLKHQHRFGLTLFTHLKDIYSICRQRVQNVAKEVTSKNRMMVLTRSGKVLEIELYLCVQGAVMNTANPPPATPIGQSIYFLRGVLIYTRVNRSIYWFQNMLL